jgi:hypothetical protein
LLFLISTSHTYKKKVTAKLKLKLKKEKVMYYMTLVIMSLIGAVVHLSAINEEAIEIGAPRPAQVTQDAQSQCRRLLNLIGNMPAAMFGNNRITQPFQPANQPGHQRSFSIMPLNQVIYGSQQFKGIKQVVELYASKFPNNLTDYFHTISKASDSLLLTLEKVFRNYISPIIIEQRDLSTGQLRVSKKIGAQPKLDVIPPALIRIDNIEALLKPLKEEQQKLIKAQKDLKSKILVSSDARQVKDVLIAAALMLEQEITHTFDDSTRLKQYQNSARQPAQNNASSTQTLAIQQPKLLEQLKLLTKRTFVKDNLITESIMSVERKAWEQFLEVTLSALVEQYASKAPNDLTNYLATLSKVSDTLLSVLQRTFDIIRPALSSKINPYTKTSYQETGYTLNPGNGTAQAFEVFYVPYLNIPELEKAIKVLNSTQDTVTKLKKDLKSKTLSSSDGKQVQELLAEVASLLATVLTKVFKDMESLKQFKASFVLESSVGKKDTILRTLLALNSKIFVDKNLIIQELSNKELDAMKIVINGSTTQGSIKQLVERYAMQTPNDLTNFLNLLNKSYNLIVNTLGEIFAQYVDPALHNNYTLLLLPRIDFYQLDLNAIKEKLKKIAREKEELIKIHNDLTKKTVKSLDAQNVKDLLDAFATMLEVTCDKILKDLNRVPKNILVEHLDNLFNKIFGTKNLITQRITDQELNALKLALNGSITQFGLKQLVLRYASQAPDNLTTIADLITSSCNVIVNTLGETFVKYIVPVLQNTNDQQTDVQPFSGHIDFKTIDFNAIKTNLQTIKKEKAELIKIEKDLTMKTVKSPDAQNVKDVLQTVINNLITACIKVSKDLDTIQATQAR